MEPIIAKCVVIAVIIAIPVVIVYAIYEVVKLLIQYNAECQDRYARYRQAEKDMNDLEDEINYMKDHDWSKEE